MTSSIPEVFNFSSRENDIDITSDKVFETDGHSTLSVHFMNCNITFIPNIPLFPKQNNKAIHSVLW